MWAETGGASVCVGQRCVRYMDQVSLRFCTCSSRLLLFAGKKPACKVSNLGLNLQSNKKKVCRSNTINVIIYETMRKLQPTLKP